MLAIQRRNVDRSGADGDRSLIFAHRHACDQNGWQPVVSALAADHEVVLHDDDDCGASDPSLHDPISHMTLEGNTEQPIALCETAGLNRPILLAHSIDTVIGVPAAWRRPRLFDTQVLTAPSPFHLDDTTTPAASSVLASTGCLIRSNRTISVGLG